MKGNDKIITVLNQLLADELTAINQYVVHAEMCDNWGYERLHEVIEKTAIDEMKHAEKLIARILFLEGRPVGYPPAAERLRREGTVVVEALIDETGAVSGVEVVERSVPGMGFEAAAIRQVMSRRYRPATKDGVPVRVRIRIRVNFKL